MYILGTYTSIYVCYMQSMDLQNPWIVLRKVPSDQYFAQQTIDLFPDPSMD